MSAALPRKRTLPGDNTSGSAKIDPLMAVFNAIALMATSLVAALSWRRHDIYGNVQKVGRLCALAVFLILLAVPLLS